MPRAFGKYTRAYEARRAWSLASVDRTVVSRETAAADHKAMLDWLAATAQALHAPAPARAPLTPVAGDVRVEAKVAA